MNYFNTEEARLRHAENNKIKGKIFSGKVREKYNKDPRKCKYCEEQLPYEKRYNSFCNSSCAASFNNKGVIRNGVPLQGKKCLSCDEQLTRYDTKFCDNKCQQDYRYIIYINKWKTGTVDGVSGDSTSGHIKRYLKEKHNNSCQECGWNKVNIHTGKVPVQLHHVDGDYKNNLEANLELLCPSCHSLTATHGSRGKGRKGRYK